MEIKHSEKEGSHSALLRFVHSVVLWKELVILHKQFEQF